MSVEFTDNSLKVKSELSAAVKAFLHEAGVELKSQTQRLSRVDTGQTKGSYDYKVISDKSGATVYIGSNLENAIWEEYGTGEYALNKDGRKGGWFVPEENLNAKSKMRKFVFSKNGSEKVFYYTKGKKPNRPLYNAYVAKQAAIKRQAEKVLKQRLGG